MVLQFFKLYLLLIYIIAQLIGDVTLALNILLIFSLSINLGQKDDN